MAYTPTIWVDNSAPEINATNLNHLETGVQTAAATADAAIPNPGTKSTNNVLVWNGSAWVAQMPPGYQYDEIEFTSAVNVTATTEATATTVVTSNALTFDGSTTIWVEFYSPYVTKGSTFTRLYLYDGTSIGFIGHIDVTGGAPFHVKRKLTPSAAVHTYSIRGSVDAGTGVVQAGAGGVGAYMPGFIRVTRA